MQMVISKTRLGRYEISQLAARAWGRFIYRSTQNWIEVSWSSFSGTSAACARTPQFDDFVRRFGMT